MSERKKKSESDLARISSDLHRRIKIASAKTGISMKEWLDDAVRAKFRKKAERGADGAAA